MAKRKTHDYRLKVTCPAMGNISFITRTGTSVSYFSGSEVPLALSNLFGPFAAEARFALKDAVAGDDAAKAARQFIRQYHPHGEPKLLPQVQVL